MSAGEMTVFWICGAVVFVAIVAGVTHGMRIEAETQRACIAAHGDWDRGACKFRVNK